MKRHLFAKIAPLAFVAVASFGIYACSDSTGPGGDDGRTVTITIEPAFQSVAAGVVQYTQAHVVVRRSDGTVALDTVVNYTAAGRGLRDDLASAALAALNGASLTLPVPLSPLADVNGERFSLELELLNSAGTVVFFAELESFIGNPNNPPTLSVSALYTGPGAAATRVEVSPATANAQAGTNVDLTAKAFASDGTELPGTPIHWSALDAFATVPDPAVGRALIGSVRGTARIRATLITGQTDDAVITVTPIPTTLAIQSGNGQNGIVGTAAQPLVAKVTAADGLGVAGVPVAFAIQSGGGTLAANEALTDANGLASAGFTFGLIPGAVNVRATVNGLTGSPATFTLTGSASTITQVVFASQPASTLVGSSLGNVTVEVRDEFGNRVTNFTGPVTISLETPPVGVTLQGTTVVNAVAGLATFSSLQVSAPGAALRLRATGAGFTALSNTFTISPRPIVALAFKTQPPATIPAGELLPTIQVEARDDLGNVATGYTGNVTLTLDGPAALADGGAPPPGVILNGTLTVPAVAGVATFPALSVNAQAAALRLIATGVNITGSFASNTFAVTAPLNPLTGNPSGTTFNAVRTQASPAPAPVQLTSNAAQVTGMAVGTIVYGPGATGWLAASLSGPTTPATLTLTPTTNTLPEGTFTANVPITAAGGLTLNYPVTVIVAPLPVTQLAVITQPGRAASGANFGDQPVVELRDATGTRVLSATAAVTASVNTGAGVLAGTVVRNAVQGRATFTDLRITGTGAHTLGFAIAGPITVNSASFNVAAALTTTQAVPTVTGTAGTALVAVIPVTAAGGIAPLTFSTSPLPAGLAFNAATGQLTGTPVAASGPTVFTVTVTDDVGTTSSKTFTLRVNAALTTTQAIPTKVGNNGTAIPAFIPVTAAGGTAPVTFAIAPAATLTGVGLAFNTNTGAVSGTPTGTLAATVFTVTATDALGATSAKTFTLTINAALTTAQAVPATVGTQGSAIPSFTPVTAAGGTTPYTFAISGGTLPPGMVFNTSTGAVSGTPFAPLALTTFTVTVTDAIGATSSKTFDLTINGPLTTTQVIASRTFNSGAAITPFTPVTAAGGTAPRTFSINPALPANLTINAATGEISGTPAGALATTVFTVTATDDIGATSSKTFTLTVNGPLTATQAVATKVGTVGAAIASFVPVTGAGGTAPYTFAISGGTLPTGLTFNTNTGAISGTPTTPLAATVFTVTITDATTATDAETFTLTVNAALVTTLAVPSTAGTVNTVIPDFTPVTASGGTAPYTFAISTPLPAGMTFDTNTGEVSGTPTVAQGATNRTVTVTDAAGAISSKIFSLTVNGALTTTQAVASRTGTQGQAIATFTPVTAAGGTTPYTFAISGGTLPAGMSFNTANGQVSGTPTATLAATVFTVTVTDNVGATSAKTFTLTVNATLVATQAVPTTTGNAGVLLTTFIPVTGSNGTPPYTFALSTPLPAGLTFNTATGAVSGTPSAAQAATVRTVTITDAAGAQAANTFSLTINGPLTTTQAIASRTFNSGGAITPFTPVTAAGGTAPLTFSINPALPANLTINAATGEISGTPAGALATTVFTVTVTDDIGAQSSKTFTLTINGPLTTTQAVPTKVGTVGAAIASFVPVTAAGGTTPYTFALTGGTLPTGLTFNTNTGAISGTPSTTLAATVFTVTVTDGAAAQSSKTFTLTVNSALTTTQAVPATIGTINTPIPDFTPVTASGGTTPYAFALSGAALPAGLAFNTATGEVTGTPTASQGATVRTVTVTDAAGAISSKTFSLTVNAALNTTQAIASRAVTQNTAITAFTPVTASGGTTPYTFDINPALPAGLSFNTNTGQITGTPTATLAATVFTVEVTDNAGAQSSKTFTLTVNTALTTTQAVPATVGTAGTAIPSFTPVTAAGGTAPLAFALSAPLPAGMSFSTTTGAVSGTPAVAQAATVRTVTVTDAAGAQSSKTFTLTVNTALTTTQAIASRVVNSGSAIAAFTPVTAAGGTAPITFSINPALPAGLTISAATGQISGTPTVTLAATVFTVTATDDAGAQSSKTFTLTVNGPLSTTQAIASRAVTQSSAITPFTPVTASGGTTPYTFGIAPALPTGLTLNTSTGAITGTPTVTLAATVFTVTVTDASSAQSSKTFTLTVNSALTTTQAVPTTSGTINTPLPGFIPVTAAGGTTPYTFALSGTALPAGLAFNTATGQITGTPTVSQAATVRTVTVTDAAGAVSSKTFSLTINAALTTTQAIASRATTVNRPFFPTASFTPVTASGGTTPYTFTLSGGTLPAGVTFNTNTGLISGTPTATLAATVFTVEVEDAAGATSSKTFTLDVNPALGATQAVPTTATTVQFAPAAFIPVTPTNGTPPYTFAITAGGSLPSGMSFAAATGTVSGTPTVAQGATVRTVTITDAAGATASTTFSLTVNAALTTTQAVPTTTGSQGTPLSFTPVTAAGGTAPLTFALSGGTLPAGVTFNTGNGLVSGTPTAPLAQTTFTVTVTDDVGAQSSKTFQLTVTGPLTTTLAIPTLTIQAGQLLAPTPPVTASGGVTPYTFAITSGTLPAGMNFNTATGAFSGTPTTLVINESITVQVTDDLGAQSSKTFTLNVNAIELVVNGTQPTTFTQGVDVEIPLELDMTNRGTDNIASLTVTVTFDPTRFQFIDENPGTPGWSVTPNTSNATSGTITLTGFVATGFTTNSTFHRLVLRPLTTGVGATVSATVTTAHNETAGSIAVAVRNLTATINP